MSHSHLNRPSLAEAREAYLRQFHLPPVSKRWGGKKPTQAQYDAAFGAQWRRRQAKLLRAEGGSTILLERDTDSVQTVAEQMVEAILPEVIELDPSMYDTVEIEESLVEKLRRIAAEKKVGVIVTQAAPATTKKPVLPKVAEVVIEPEHATVKPENASKLPNYRQVAYLIHRAIEGGSTYAQIPVRRDDTATVIGLIEGGKTLEQAMRAWRRRSN